MLNNTPTKRLHPARKQRQRARRKASIRGQIKPYADTSAQPVPGIREAKEQRVLLVDHERGCINLMRLTMLNTAPMRDLKPETLRVFEHLGYRLAEVKHP